MTFQFNSLFPYLRDLERPTILKVFPNFPNSVYKVNSTDGRTAFCFLIIQGHQHPGEWPDHSMKLTKGYKSESILATRHSYKNSTPPIRRVHPGETKWKFEGDLTTIILISITRVYFSNKPFWPIWELWQGKVNMLWRTDIPMVPLAWYKCLKFFCSYQKNKVTSQIPWSPHVPCQPISSPSPFIHMQRTK